MDLTPNPKFYTKDDLKEFDSISVEELRNRSTCWKLEIGRTYTIDAPNFKFKSEAVCIGFLGFNGRIAYFQIGNTYVTADSLTQGRYVK